MELKINNYQTSFKAQMQLNGNINLLKEKLYLLGAKNVNTDGEYITQKRHYYAWCERRFLHQRNRRGNGAVDQGQGS